MLNNNYIPKPREGLKKGIYLLPNLCTTANLFCGFYAIIASLKGEFTSAAWAILMAGIFDFLDGRIARLAHAHSEFGIEYDSLVDLASFGLAAGVLVYTWALQEFHKIGWLITFLFFACSALRLARFNVQIDNVEKKYFQGLPVPIAAYTIATFVIFYDYLKGIPPLKSYLALFMTVVLAILMVSTLRYHSFKEVDFRSRWSSFVLVIVIVGFFVIAAEPKVTIFFIVVAYVASGIVEELLTMRKSRTIWEHFQTYRALRVLKMEEGGETDETEERDTVSEIPSTKSQIPNKFQ